MFFWFFECLKKFCYVFLFFNVFLLFKVMFFFLFVKSLD